MNKYLLLFLVLASLNCSAQEKETIYVDYDSLQTIENFDYKNQKGIAFHSHGIHLFYSYTDEMILISKEKANAIKPLSYEEIHKKQGEMSYKKFKLYVWGDRNSYFNTFIIKYRKDGCAEIYPIIWINEGLQE